MSTQKSRSVNPSHLSKPKAQKGQKVKRAICHVWLIWIMSLRVNYRTWRKESWKGSQQIWSESKLIRRKVCWTASRRSTDLVSSQIQKDSYNPTIKLKMNSPCQKTRRNLNSFWAKSSYFNNDRQQRQTLFWNSLCSLPWDPHHLFPNFFHQFVELASNIETIIEENLLRLFLIKQKTSMSKKFWSWSTKNIQTPASSSSSASASKPKPIDYSNMAKTIMPRLEPCFSIWRIKPTVSQF